MMSAALISAVFLGAQYFQFVLHYPPLSAGLHLLPWTATPIFIAPTAGMLSDRIGRRPVMMAGMILLGVGLGWMGLVATQGADYAQLVLPLLIAGVGVSMVLPTSPTAALSAVATADMGKAAGVNSTMQRFGSVFGVAAATAVFTANGHLGSAAGFSAGFRPALGLAAGLSMLGAFTALGVGGRRRTAQTVEVREAVRQIA
jgi:MFS family permease